MAQDHLYWKNGIDNEFSPASLTDAAEGSGFVATAVISSVTTKSGFHMSQYDAYKDLFERLHQGQKNVLPQHTTTEKNALTNIYDGVRVLDITLGREDICFGGAFVSPAGAGTMKPAAFGEMVEDNPSGSSINTTSKLWDTASVGELDGNGIITYLNTANGDELKVGVGGAGTYQIHFSCTFTNASGNMTECGIHKNGVQVGKLEDTHSGDSAEKRDLRGSGFLVLADNDLITLHVVSSTPSDVVTVYHCHITMQRMT